MLFSVFSFNRFRKENTVIKAAVSPQESKIRFHVQLSNGIEIKGSMPKSLSPNLDIFRDPDNLKRSIHEIKPNEQLAIFLPPSFVEFFKIE